MTKATKKVETVETTNVEANVTFEQVLANLTEEQRNVILANSKVAKTRKNTMTRKQFWNDAVDLNCKPNAIFNEGRYIGFNTDSKKIIVEDKGKVVEVDCYKEIFEAIANIVNSKLEA